MANPLSILGLGLSVYGQMEQAQAQSAALTAAARNLYTEAAQTMRQGEYVAMVRALDLEQQMGAARVAAASSGVDTGVGQSVRTGLNQTETFGRLDVQMERLNAARKARGLREQAKSLQRQAKEVREQAVFEGFGTVLGAGAKLFG